MLRSVAAHDTSELLQVNTTQHLSEARLGLHANTGAIKFYIKTDGGVPRAMPPPQPADWPADKAWPEFEATESWPAEWSAVDAMLSPATKIVGYTYYKQPDLPEVPGTYGKDIWIPVFAGPSGDADAAKFFSATTVDDTFPYELQGEGEGSMVFPSPLSPEILFSFGTRDDRKRAIRADHEPTEMEKLDMPSFAHETASPEFSAAVINDLPQKPNAEQLFGGMQRVNKFKKIVQENQNVVYVDSNWLPTQKGTYFILGNEFIRNSYWREWYQQAMRASYVMIFLINYAWLVSSNCHEEFQWASRDWESMPNAFFVFALVDDFSYKNSQFIMDTFKRNSPIPDERIQFYPGAKSGDETLKLIADTARNYVGLVNQRGPPHSPSDFATWWTEAGTQKNVRRKKIRDSTNMRKRN